MLNGLRRNAAAPSGLSRATALSTRIGICDRRGILMHLLHHLPTRHHRHHQVQDDQVRLLRLVEIQKIERLLAIARRENVEAVGLEDVLQDVANLEIVLDEEHRLATHA